MANFTKANWQIIRHVYSGWVELDGDQLRNARRLPDRHFQALALACRTKTFGNRDRGDDSLRNAIGNWLYSRKFGAWRNPNRDKRYKDSNKDLWEKFCAEGEDFSLRRARAEVTDVAYWFMNTDKGTGGRKFATRDLWFKHQMAFSGDDWDQFGLPLGQLNVDDVCLMYDNGVGIVGVGRVAETWDRKAYKANKIVYANQKFPEYRLRVNWYIDIREEPVDTRSEFGYVPQDFLGRIVKHRKAAIALVRKLEELSHCAERTVRAAVEQAQGKSQGFSVPPAVRKAVEAYAMEKATTRFERDGYTVRDVSNRESYDLSCTRGDEVLHVEVKGTQTAGDKILLTRGEVRLARKKSPHTALFVAHSVAVVEDGGKPRVSGGGSRIIRPWNPTSAMLKPLVYSCEIAAK